MTKVVVNRCYGGFSISLAAARYMAKRGSKKALAEVAQYERRKSLVAYFRAHGEWPDGSDPEETRWLHPDFEDEPTFFGYGYADDGTGDTGGYDRADPLLVEAVERLKHRADGSCAELVVVEIPDGVEWTIDDYDGMEKVCEKHREW